MLFSPLNAVPIAAMRMSSPDVPDVIPLLGGSGVGEIAVVAIAKISLAVALARSLALTFTFRVPISVLAGMPLNVRVVVLKVSQLGRAFPFSVAE